MTNQEYDHPNSLFEERAVPGTGGSYKVTPRGAVLSYKIDSSGKELSQNPNSSGYLTVGLSYPCRDNPLTKKVHRLVAETYLYPPPGTVGVRSTDYQINHIDGDKENNHYQNLEWLTARQNYEHALRTGLLSDGLTQNLGLGWNKGEQHSQSKLKSQSVRLIRALVSTTNLTKTKISKIFGISRRQVNRIIDNRSHGGWQHIHLPQIDDDTYYARTVSLPHHS